MQKDKDLYDVLLRLLKANGEPMTALELFDKPDTKKWAKTANRVSDYLGNLWRRGLLMRVPIDRKRHEGTRFAYLYIKTDSNTISLKNAKLYEPKKVQIESSKYTVTERHGELVIETKDFRIVISPHKPGG